MTTAGPDTFDVAGPVGAPAIVFVHGTRLTRAAWTPQVGALSDTYRIVTASVTAQNELDDVQPKPIDS